MSEELLATAPETPRQALHALLDAGLPLAPEYAQGLADHSPMALHALWALGAPAGRLSEWAAHYRPRLHPRPPAPGSGDAAAGFETERTRFVQQIARHGTRATLSAALPDLMPGVSAGAFHGLIRSAHALASEHAEELASALAYWSAASDNARLAAADDAAQIDLHEWLTALQALPAPPMSGAPRIFERMRAWAVTPGFQGIAGQLMLPTSDADGDGYALLGRLARHAAALYAGSGDFTLLHAVTASQAMQLLWPLKPAPHAALRHFSIALAAALCASRVADRVRPGTAAGAWAWPDIVAAAIAADDDHTAKLVYSCRHLARVWPDPVWAQAATRAAGAQTRAVKG